MTQEQARVLARSGNIAVTQLDGRAIPGIHIQGDTFAELQRQAAAAVGRLRQAPAESDALDEIDSLVEEMVQILGFFEATLAEHDIRLPYFRENMS
jgi:hypothetical protein